MNQLSKIIAQINKKYGEGTIYKASELTPPKLYPSGSPMIDYAIGGGWPSGRVIELFGAPGTGKTVLSLLAIANVQKIEKDPKCLFIDAEGTFDIEFAAKLGVDIDNLAVVKMSEAEKVFDLIKETVKTEKPHIIVIDSLAALMPLEDVEKTQEVSVMATRARALTRGLGVTNAVNTDTIILCTNQIRANLSKYGAPTDSTGGFATKHYTSLRVRVAPGDLLLNEKKREVGKQIKFKVVKSKTSQPNIVGVVDFYYNGTIDPANELFQLGIILEIIERKGSFYKLFGKTYQGQANLVQAIRDDSELFKKLYEEIVEEKREG